MSTVETSFESAELAVQARHLAHDGTARRLRLDAELSLREVGRIVGTDASTVLRWERGEFQPKRKAARYGELLARLARLSALRDVPTNSNADAGNVGAAKTCAGAAHAQD